MSECQCLVEREQDDQPNCGAESPSGSLCTRPEGHDGSHSACSVAQHPVEVWEVSE